MNCLNLVDKKIENQAGETPSLHVNVNVPKYISKAL
jgi:hypothetical protein